MGGLMYTVKVLLFASWFGFENNVYLCDTL